MRKKTTGSLSVKKSINLVMGQSKEKEFSMKKFFRLFGIIALAAVIGLTMTSCGDGDDGGSSFKTLTVTGMPDNISGEVSFELYDRLFSSGGTSIAGGRGIISGGSITINIWSHGQICEGSGSFYIYFFPDPSSRSTHFTERPIDFSSRTTTVPYSQFSRS